MAKSFILVLVAFVSIEYAVGLDCYATDFSKALSTGVLEPHLQDCHEYVTNMLSMQGINKPLPPMDYRCFTLKFTKDSTPLEAQGCIPRSTCGAVEHKIRSLGQSGSLGGSVKRIQCRECSGRGCNAPFRFIQN